MTDTTTRFQVLPHPKTAPGKCACCGSVSRPVIDFGFDVDYYGTVYLCRNCVCEAATNFDMVPFAELEQERIARFNAQVVEGRVEGAVKRYMEETNELWQRFNADLYRAAGIEPGVSSRFEGVSPEQIIISVDDENSDGVAGQKRGASSNKRPSEFSVGTGNDSDGFSFD